MWAWMKRAFEVLTVGIRSMSDLLHWGFERAVNGIHYIIGACALVVAWISKTIWDTLQHGSLIKDQISDMSTVEITEQTLASIPLSIQSLRFANYFLRIELWLWAFATISVFQLFLIGYRLIKSWIPTVSG